MIRASAELAELAELAVGSTVVAGLIVSPNVAVTAAESRRVMFLEIAAGAGRSRDHSTDEIVPV